MSGEWDEPRAGEGAVKSLEADGLRRPRESFSRTDSKIDQVGGEIGRGSRDIDESVRRCLSHLRRAGPTVPRPRAAAVVLLDSVSARSGAAPAPSDARGSIRALVGGSWEDRPS